MEWRRLSPLQANLPAFGHETAFLPDDAFERQKMAKLSKEQEKALRANRKASAFFDAQPLGYRWLTIHRVVSAKRPETRERRLAQLSPTAPRAGGSARSRGRTKRNQQIRTDRRKDRQTPAFARPP